MSLYAGHLARHGERRRAARRARAEDLLTEEHPRIRQVVCHDEVPQERVADEAVVDDPLEHHVRVTQRERRRGWDTHDAAQTCEVAGIRVAGLVATIHLA